MTTASAALAELEDAEFHGVDAVTRLAPGDPRRAELQALLTKARAVKGNLLARSPDILRKSGMGISPAVAREVVETADRMAEERRLGPGRRRYLAPEKLRGQSLRLVDGSRIYVPEHGHIEVADGRHPAGASEGPVHRQLIALGFRVLPDGREDQMDVVKAALRDPIIGDTALIAFLSRNCSEGLRT
jgi:hypothetical protein